MRETEQVTTTRSEGQGDAGQQQRGRGGAETGLMLWQVEQGAAVAQQPCSAAAACRPRAAQRTCLALRAAS
jgi:hypothetical protein